MFILVYLSNYKNVKHDAVIAKVKLTHGHDIANICYKRENLMGQFLFFSGISAAGAGAVDW